ncbi:MAG: 2-dehydropantoate 2-reductase [Thermoplasmata archaeon]|nr:MAG: 2-dehydropantoate 2-reductase [Thermoplasmata archaeon]RLF33842.1 MAG: 2-dehydropantoate 2-reductase [Thermoplasmata archaeon]RLF52939.1 MAG: 2-dehydropantoate 2-reductase [Thermoplasmata archaeon]
MNIVIFGAGAIGSLFGAMLFKNNKVVLIGRKPHVEAIRKKGLTITGKTQLNTMIPAETTVENIKTHVDLLMLTVKSYDTMDAMNHAKNIIDKDTFVLSLQNGLDNIEKISKVVKRERILAGVTTHAAVFNQPGVIIHTGTGYTVIGSLDRKNTDVVKTIATVFNNAGIKTTNSKDILSEIWVKAIVNSSINPLTALFQCKNGYLLENPVLESIVEKICTESTMVAVREGIKLSTHEMFEKTMQVVRDTRENFSSMLQSIRKGKPTEIDSINGKIVELAEKQGIPTPLNKILLYSIHSLY